MIVMSSLERGTTMLEMLVTVAIVTIALLAGAAVIVSSHPNERTRAASQLIGVIDRAHGIAPTDGATLEIAPAGKGSTLTLLDGFLGGNAVEAVTTGIPVALQYSGGVIDTAQIAIRRDGSWYPVVNNAQQTCNGSEAIGLIGPQARAAAGAPAQLAESYALSCTDLHISVAQ